MWDVIQLEQVHMYMCTCTCSSSDERALATSKDPATKIQWHYTFPKMKRSLTTLGITSETS